MIDRNKCHYSKLTRFQFVFSQALFNEYANCRTHSRTVTNEPETHLRPVFKESEITDYEATLKIFVKMGEEKIFFDILISVAASKIFIVKVCLKCV